MNHQKTHQTNPMAPWNPLDAPLGPSDHLDCHTNVDPSNVADDPILTSYLSPLTPWDPVGLPPDS